jgi:hypothetical protein
VLGHGSVLYLDYGALNGYDRARPYRPNLADTLTNLGVLVDQPIQRRISRTGFTR